MTTMNKTILQQLLEMTQDAFAKVRLVCHSTFRRRGIDLVLPAHAGARAVEGERGRAVTEEFLITALQAFLRAWDSHNEAVERVKQQAQELRGRPAQATIRHPVEDTYVNIPFALEWHHNRYTFVLKTVMVKRDFHTYANDIVIEV